MFISSKNIVFKKGNCRRFFVFITEIWPVCFLKCFIITNFFNVQFFKVSFFWFSLTVLNSNVFVFYKGTSFCSFFFVRLIFEYISSHNFLSKLIGHNHIQASSSPVTSTNVEIKLQKFPTFSFIPFVTLV